MKKLHFPSHLSRVESFCLITLSQIHFESFLCLQTRNPQALLSQKNGMDEVVKFSQQNFLFLRPTTSKLTFFIFTILTQIFPLADKFQSPNSFPRLLSYYQPTSILQSSSNSPNCFLVFQSSLYPTPMLQSSFT